MENTIFNPEKVISAMIRNRTSVFARFPTGGWIKIGYSKPHSVTYRGKFYTSIYSAESHISEEDARLVMAFISNLKVNKYRETPTPKKAMGKTRSDDVFVDIHRVAQIVSKIPKLTEDFPGFNPMEKVNDTQVIKMHNKFSRVCVAVVFSYTQTEDVVYFSDTQKIFRKKVLEKIDFFVQSGGYKIIP